MKIFDAELTKNPEDLYLFLKEQLRKFDFWDPDDLHLEVMPDREPKVLILDNGQKILTSIEMPAARPKRVQIIFFGREIGRIHIEPIKSWSRAQMYIKASTEKDASPSGRTLGANPEALDSDRQAMTIMQNLAAYLGILEATKGKENISNTNQDIFDSHENSRISAINKEKFKKIEKVGKLRDD